MTKVSSTKKSAMLTDEAIAKYLEEQPEFFLRNKELLTSLKVNHTERGVVSLVEIQLSRLRERVSELEEEITQLMSVAVSNEQLYRAIAQAHKELFAAQNEARIYQILNQLGSKLNLLVNMRFYGNDDHPLAKIDVQRIKASHFLGQSIYLGRLRKADGEVFIENAPELGSYLLIPIYLNEKESGFLSFASQEGGHFQPHMDTLFVEQLSQHIAISIAMMRN